MKKPPIAFLPRPGLLTPELFAKVCTNERMGIQIAGIGPDLVDEFPEFPKAQTHLSSRPHVGLSKSRLTEFM
jgi:hypothetical protein